MRNDILLREIELIHMEIPGNFKRAEFVFFFIFDLSTKKFSCLLE
jgi:hypothetical protein